MTLTVVACSNNEDESKTNGNIIGAYNGPMDIKVDGTSQSDTDIAHEVVIKQATDTSKTNVSIANFSIFEHDLGTISINDCDYIQNEGKYLLHGSTNIILNMGLDLKCPTNISGTVIGNTITLTLNIEVPSLDQSVVVSFTGVKK